MGSAPRRRSSLGQVLGRGLGAVVGFQSRSGHRAVGRVIRFSMSETTCVQVRNTSRLECDLPSLAPDRLLPPQSKGGPAWTANRQDRLYLGESS